MGGGFPVENKGKGEGAGEGGGGVGAGKGTGKLMRKLCRNHPLAIYPLVSPLKKEPKPKLLGTDIFGRGGGLPREGVGAEKFGMSLETRETKLFWRDIPGFLPGYPGGARKV